MYEYRLQIHVTRLDGWTVTSWIGFHAIESICDTGDWCGGLFPLQCCKRATSQNLEVCLQCGFVYASLREASLRTWAQFLYNLTAFPWIYSL
jgi:hypothetical protein